MHPRPRAAKRARVSFDPDLAVVTESPITEGVPATGHQGGGWGGHWQTRTEMPQLTTGKGKEAMEDLVDLPLDTLEAMLLDQDLSDTSPAVYTTSFLQATTSLPISRPPRTGRRQQTKKKPVGLQKRPALYSRKPDQP